MLDLWVNQWRNRNAQGDVIIVRYADDFTMGFQHRGDAERFLRELHGRLEKFGLDTASRPKTRLIEFGRFAASSRKRRGEGNPETFDFLGFTHCCGEDRNGRFVIRRRSVAKRLRATLQAVKAELTRRMHSPLVQQGPMAAERGARMVSVPCRPPQR